MSAPKITPTQQRVLDALEDGATLSYCLGRVRVHTGRWSFEVPAATITALANKGLVIADASGVRLAESSS